MRVRQSTVDMSADLPVGVKGVGCTACVDAHGQNP